ncbi:MAG: nucleotide sugar dehydrogenase [Clostridia bacterium]|nr:nucleotide sugar dehydrogenase [Clostridia bacterium]
MSLYEKLLRGEEQLALVGLGYVGMPIAVAFARKVRVIGYDLNQEKIRCYRSGKDPTKEVGDEAVADTSVFFTSDESDLDQAMFFIVAVPTPVNQDKTPNLDPVLGASVTVGRHIRRGAIVVFESTVYPGVTEDLCVPVIERESGLVCGKDFWVGYSPERINPGDKVHRLENIRKIVSGMDEESLEEIRNVYNLVIEAGTVPVSSIKTAEAIKVVENSQRDINIAFMNELAMVFDRLGIDTNEVVDGMNTKWNALGFRPGLVGGHCIGVDPYYFTYEAEKLGYHSQIILSGRKVNDGMGQFVADAAIKQMILAGKTVKLAKVIILGLTFKENCPDIRNSKVEDIIRRLQEYGIEPVVIDPHAAKEEAMREYGVHLSTLEEAKGADCVIVAVAHDCFRALPLDAIEAMYRPGPASEKVLVDVKGIYPIRELKKHGFAYWRL